MFARASSSVRPWLMASGTSTTCATHQPSPARPLSVGLRAQQQPRSKEPDPPILAQLAHSHTAAHETSRHAKTHLAGGLSLTGRSPAAETYRQGKRKSPENWG